MVTSSTDDTIAAVSSPPGRAPRGLLRLAGPDAQSILTSLVGSDCADNAFGNPRTLEEARLQHPDLPNLPVLVAAFRAPHSYTTQDLAEVQTPGHPALLERLMRAALDAGARTAQPGEFTFRAFTAGRIDLTQAEGIAATISATSDSQLQAATLLRAGRLGTFAGELVDTLGNQLALVEAGIDFVDQEDVVPVMPAQLDERIDSLADRVDHLLRRSRSWGALDALPRVVLVGAPSAGKSTLFNALLGRTRAVIDEAPGTTRDVLVEPLMLTAPNGQGVEAQLVDIAGLDRPAAALDEQVQEAAQQAVRQADVIVHVIPAEAEASALGLALPTGAAQLTVRSKADQLAAASSSDALAVSAHTGANLDALRRAIAEGIGDRGVSVSAEMLALQPRHEQALRAAAAHLIAARQLVHPQREHRQLEHTELIAGELRGALDQLAGLGGRLTPDDVLGRVFATFCIGK